MFEIHFYLEFLTSLFHAQENSSVNKLIFCRTIESHITVPWLHLLSSTNNGRQRPFSIASSIAEYGPRWLEQVLPWDNQRQMGNRDKEFLSPNTFVTIKGAQTIYSTRLDQHAWSYITWRSRGGQGDGIYIIPTPCRNPL